MLCCTRKSIESPLLDFIERLCTLFLYLRRIFGIENTFSFFHVETSRLINALHPGHCNHRPSQVSHPTPLYRTDATDLNRSSNGIPSVSSNPLLTETAALALFALFFASSSSIAGYLRSHRLLSESSSSRVRVARRLAPRTLEAPWLLKLWSRSREL